MIPQRRSQIENNTGVDLKEGQLVYLDSERGLLIPHDIEPTVQIGTCRIRNVNKIERSAITFMSKLKKYSKVLFDVDIEYQNDVDYVVCGNDESEEIFKLVTEEFTKMLKELNAEILELNGIRINLIELRKCVKYRILCKSVYEFNSTLPKREITKKLEESNIFKVKSNGKDYFNFFNYFQN